VGCYFADIVLKENVEHLHAHFATYPALVAMIVHRLTGRDFTFTAHAHDIFLEKALLKEKVREAKYVVTISEYNKRYLTDFCGPGAALKIHVVHCGLDLAEWTYAPHLNGTLPVRFLSVGRLTEMKGFEYLIRACGRIKDKADFKVHIVGDGHLRPHFEELIKEMDLSERVILEGVLDSAHVRALMNESTVFVAPSVWNDTDGQDGIPLVLMEAMAIGKPAIASRISGIPELIQDNKSGFLVEPENARELAEKMWDLANNPKSQENFSKNGRQKIEQEFDIQKSVAQLEELFQNS
jgi:glycosyltransferase involved in cell wall biosynthesis